jgi:hypothetical protein
MDSSKNLKTTLIKVDKNKNSEVQHIGSSKNLILKTALIIKEFNFETALIKLRHSAHGF